MGEYIANFKRYEKKYIITAEQKERLLEMAKDYIKPSEFHKTSICNIYFDTDDYKLVRTSMLKPVYKEKIRLRGYENVSEDSQVYVELKKKYKGEVGKRRIGVKYKDAIDFITKGQPPKKVKNKQILEEFNWFLKREPELKPKIFISYNRVAYVGIEDENVRLTFDTDITWRTDDVDLTKGNYGKVQLGPDHYIMEIKVPSVMPLWLVDILSELKIYPKSYSKVGVCYENNIKWRYEKC